MYLTKRLNEKKVRRYGVKITPPIVEKGNKEKNEKRTRKG